LRFNYEDDYKDPDGEYSKSWIKREVTRQAKENFKEAKKAASRGELAGDKTFAKARDAKVNKEAIRDAKRYIKNTEGLSKKQLLKRLDDGDSSKSQLLRMHRRELREAKKTLSSSQKTDAQSKTAKVPKGRNPGLQKIADKMKANGREGWVTINGNRILLG
jgi:hypothetical protein